MFRDFSTGFVDTDNIALNEKKVQSIIDLDLTNYPHLIGERDRFIVAYNFLLRFEDSIKVNKGDITEIGGSYFFNLNKGGCHNPRVQNDLQHP